MRAGFMMRLQGEEQEHFRLSALDRRHIRLLGSYLRPHVGAMIGAGIFVLTGIAAGNAGPAALIAFGLNGIITLFTALSYAELSSAYFPFRQKRKGPTTGIKE